MFWNLPSRPSRVSQLEHGGADPTNTHLLFPTEPTAAFPFRPPGMFTQPSVLYLYSIYTNRNGSYIVLNSHLSIFCNQEHIRNL